MIPAELEVSTLDLPNSDHCRIVVSTNTELRHDRFALRLQAEFPGLVLHGCKSYLLQARPFVLL